MGLEGGETSGDELTDASQTDHAEAVPIEVSPDGRLPAAASDSGVRTYRRVSIPSFMAGV